jgi:hypothetical protein
MEIRNQKWEIIWGVGARGTILIPAEYNASNVLVLKISCGNNWNLIIHLSGNWVF